VARAKLTTKTLAQRIDLHYFKRAHPFRRLRTILSVCIPLLALIWLGWYAIGRNNRVYSSGTMSASHTVLTERCNVCHIKEASSFSAKADDAACESCHDGPIHHANQVFTPTCASCHREHRGRMWLAATAALSCTQCHANLRAAGAPTHFAQNITRFDGGHPEFAAVRSGSLDPGTIKLNHAVHMKHDLKGPNGPVQMDCGDCHRAATSNDSWRFGSVQSIAAQPMHALPANAPTDREPFPRSMNLGRAYMSPIAYAKHCIACHGLQFDPRFQESVPHDTPTTIHAFLVQKFQQYIPNHPAELRVMAPNQNIPEKPLPPNVRVLTPEEWVTLRVAESEELLWRKTCAQCHSLSFAPTAALPTIAKSNITPRWFEHAVFDHDAHKFVKCSECHASALKSQETADILLPGIQTCEKCHHQGTESAESRCFECHTYHNWDKEKAVKGNFTFPSVISSN
jgi:hypothetical protein